MRQESLRTLTAISSLYGLTLHHVDVTTAFLNGALNEEVYMEQPDGYEENPGGERLVCRLKKSIYYIVRHLSPIRLLYSRALM